jgi:hypothetical protein
MYQTNSNHAPSPTRGARPAAAPVEDDVVRAGLERKQDVLAEVLRADLEPDRDAAALGADLVCERLVVGRGDEVAERGRGDGILALGQLADAGDLVGDLGPREVPAGTGLGALPGLEVERANVAVGHELNVPPKLGRGELVKVPRVGAALLVERAALAAADPGAGHLGALGERDLGARRERAKGHVAHKDGDLQPERLLGAGADDDARVDGVAVKERALGQLSSQDADVGPLWQCVRLVAHAHCVSYIHVFSKLF